MFNGFLTDYFGFNKQQRNGLLVLACLSFILFLIRITYPYFIKPDDIVIKNLPLFERKLDSLTDTNQKAQKRKSGFKKQIQLFAFNPNTVNFEQLQKLGFKEKTAKTFLKYRKKKGRFKNKTDIKKINSISDSFYKVIEPYILFDSEKKAEEYFKPEVTKKPEVKEVITTKEKLIVELNAADSITLLKINGIGPSFAKRIIKYRSLLGGFIQVEQLKEVFGFTADMYQNIAQYVSVNPQSIKKLNLNNDPFKTINKHPYLSYELTKTIFDWRRKTTITVTNLKGILNNEELYNKLLPYLTFE